MDVYLQHGGIKCVAFNCHGTLLAAGCTNGRCLIWDYQNSSVAMVLRDKDCFDAITSVCWSEYGYRILVSTIDRSLTLWDFSKGNKIATFRLQHTPMQTHLYPGSARPSVCLVCPLSSAPLLVDLNATSKIVLPVTLSCKGKSRKRVSREPFPVSPIAACFNKYGDLVYVGNSEGEILIIDLESIKIRGVILVPGGARIKDIGFSRNGRYLYTNSSDGHIRIYENLLPLEDAHQTLNTHQTLNNTNHEESAQNEFEKLKAVGSRCLAPLRELEDSVTKLQWKASGISSDGELVAVAPASRGDCKIYVWNWAQRLVKFLEGPKEMKFIDLAWHPVDPVLLAVSFTGSVYIWNKNHAESWSTSPPDFEVLETNEEHAEQEDEFEVMPEKEIVKNSDANEDAVISDPCPDMPEQSWLVSGSQSRSEKAGQHNLLTNCGSFSPEEVGIRTYVRRNRKSSERPSNSGADNVEMPPPSK